MYIPTQYYQHPFYLINSIKISIFLLYPCFTYYYTKYILLHVLEYLWQLFICMRLSRFAVSLQKLLIFSDWDLVTEGSKLNHLSVLPSSISSFSRNASDKRLFISSVGSHIPRSIASISLCSISLIAYGLTSSIHSLTSPSRM